MCEGRGAVESNITLYSNAKKLKFCHIFQIFVGFNRFKLQLTENKIDQKQGQASSQRQLMMSVSGYLFFKP